MSTTDGPSRSVLLAAVLVAGAASGGCTETSLHVRVEDVRQVALESAYPPGVVFVSPGQEPSRRPLAVASFWPSPDRDVVAERRASGGITLGSWDHLVADDGWLEPVVLGDSGEAGVTEGRLRLHYSYGLGGGRRYLRVELTTPVSNVSQLWQRRGPDRAMAAASIAFGILVSGLGAASLALFNPPGTWSFSGVFVPSLVIATGVGIDIGALVRLFAPDVDKPLSPSTLETTRVR